MDANDYLPPQDDTPIVNKLIEDALAYGTTQGDRDAILECWMRIGAEYMARECGRREATKQMNGLLNFVQTAQPTKPWPR